MIKYKKVLTYDKDRTVTNSKHWSIWLPFLKDTFSVKKIILQMSLNKYLSRFIVRIYFFSRESSRHCRVVLSSSVHTEAIINFSVFGRGSTVESFHCPFAAACKHGLCVCHCTLCVCVWWEREREREMCMACCHAAARRKPGHLHMWCERVSDYSSSWLLLLCMLMLGVVAGKASHQISHPSHAPS